MSKISRHRSLGATLGALLLTFAALAIPGCGLWKEKPAKAGIAELINNLGDADAKVRKKVAEDLGQLGPPAKEAVPALIKALGDPEKLMRMEAALALGHIGSEAKEAVPALIKTLGDPEVGVQEFAIASLGPEAKEAVPALIKVLGDRWQAVRWRAAYALGDIGPEAKQAIPELERVAEEDPDGLVRQNAHDALEKIRK